MKKKLFAVMLLALSLGVVAACNGEEEPTEETSTIQFYNSEGWAEVFATAQNNEGEELLGDFPGTEATAVDGADDFYEIEVPVESVLNDPVTIQFNDGDSEEAEPSTVNHPDFIYVTIEADGVYGTRENARFSMREVDDTRVYFYNAHEWEDMNAYAWNGSDYFGGWPGSADAVNEDDRDGWYYVDVPEDVDEQEIGFIINGSDAEGEDVQTEDILINDSSLVYLHPEIEDEGYGFDSYEAAEADFEGLMAATTVHFLNDAVADTDFDGWDDVYVDAVDYDGEQLLEDEAVEADNAWHSIDVPFSFADHGEDAYFEVTFHDGDGNEATTQTIEDEESVYVTYDALYDDMGEAERVSSGVTVVEFYNDAEWDNVYATAENSDLDFDDVEANEDEDGWFYVEVPLVVFEDDDEATFDIYFHDGNGNESPTQTIESPESENVLSSDGVWASRDVAETFIYADADDFLTFHFHNYYEWDDLRAYIWDGEGHLVGEWPGMHMEHDEDQWYTLDIPIDLADDEVDIAALVFNGVDAEGEDAQTDDFVVEDDSELYFTVTGGMYDNREDAEAGVEEALAGTEVFFHNADGWDDVHATVEHDELDETFEEAAVSEGDDWFSVNVPLVYDEDFTDSFDITFHDGDGEEVDATIVGETYVYVTADDVFTSQDAAELMYTTEDDDLVDIHVYNSEGWEGIHTYVFPHGELLGWPGIHMNETDDAGWYHAQLPLDTDRDLDPDDEDNDEYGIIFNDALGEDQTDNFMFDNLDEMYFIIEEDQDEDGDTIYVAQSFESQDDAEAALE